jgi:hypothetical protein
VGEQSPIYLTLTNGENMSLYKNMNARKKAGTSRSKSKSTISAKAYKNMKAGFPKKKKT